MIGLICAQKEKNIAPVSNTETFFALRMHIENKRFQGVQHPLFVATRGQQKQRWQLIQR